MVTILIVDDRPTDRQLLVTLLGYEGHRLLEAADGAEALAVAHQEQPGLVISDLMMPTMDGFEFVRQLRAIPALAQTPVIFYTASYHEQEARTLANVCGGAAILSKPADPEVILQTVRTALGQAPPAPIIPAEDFTREHERLLADKLIQKVTALEAANQRLATLIDLGLQLGSEREPKRLLQHFAESARDIIAARYAAVGALNGDEQQLRHYCTSGMPADMVAQIGAPSPRQGLLGTLLAERRCIRLRGLAGDPQAVGLPATHPPIHTFLAAPLASLTRIYGWLYLVDKLGGDEFSAEDERLAGILAAQVGRIYENGSLYTHAQQRAGELEREVVQRRQAEEDLVAARTRLQYVIAYNPAVIYTLAIERPGIARLAWMSENLQEMLGYTVAEGQSFNWWCMNIHSEDRDRVMASVARDLFDHGRVANEYRFRHRDGTYRWVRSEMRLVRDPAGNPVEAVGSWSDITERKQLEEQFRQSQKMEAVGRLAGGIAHDFNNLLTVINGYSEMLITRLREGDPMRGMMEQIKRSGERAALLTRQLLAFSRKQVLVPVVLDLNTILTDMDKMLRRLIGEDLDLLTSLDPQLWRVKADPGQIEQVVMNLVVNARDAMAQGGKLTIETRNVELDDKYVAIHPEAKAGEYAQLAISDTGHGMDRATQARIFEPFFTTKGPDKGTGLGLATVYGIVKQSEGYIEVYSEPGQGTTFKVYLPRSTTVAPLRGSDPARAKPAGGSETILLVEDDGAVRSLTRMILEDRGFTVLEAANGGEALLRCEQHPGPIHLLVTDVVMPHMSGPQLAERLAQLRPGLQRLFLSGYTDEAIVHHGVLSADMPFLQKPFRPEVLVRKVREVLDGRR